MPDSATMAAAHSDSFNINIKTLNPHATHEISVSSSDHVVDLKTTIEGITGVPPARQRLLYLGRALVDNAQTLGSAGIQSGHTLHMVERPAAAVDQPATQPPLRSNNAMPGQPMPGTEAEARAHGVAPGLNDQIMNQVLGSIFQAISADAVNFGSMEGVATGSAMVGIGPDGTAVTIPIQQAFGVPGAGGLGLGVGNRQQGQQGARGPAEAARPLLTTIQNYVERLVTSSESRSSLPPLMSSPSSPVLPEARRIDNERRWFSAAQRVLQNVDLQPETRRWVEATVMEALARPPPSSSAEIPTPPSTAPSGTAQQATGGREQAAESASGRAAYGDGTRQSTAPSAAHVQGHPTGTVQEPWEANPSDPQVASVVAVAVGNILQRSQDVWALGPQPALERAAQELQSLTGPVPRGMQTPPNPAVDAVSAAGRHLYAFGALAWELARLCRIVAPALQGQVQLQLATGRPAFISPDGTSPRVPFATGRPEHGGHPHISTEVSESSRVSVRLPNGAVATGNFQGPAPSAEDFAASLSSSLNFVNNTSRTQPQGQSQQPPTGNGTAGEASTPTQHVPQQTNGTGVGSAMHLGRTGTTSSAGTTSATRSASTTRSASASGATSATGTTSAAGATSAQATTPSDGARPSWQTVSGMIYHPPGPGQGPEAVGQGQPIPLQHQDLHMLRGHMAQHGVGIPEGMFSGMVPPGIMLPGMTNWHFGREEGDGDVAAMEGLDPDIPRNFLGGVANDLSSQASAAQSQLRGMITGVVVPIVQHALAATGLLGGAEAPGSDNTYDDAQLPENIVETLGSSIAEALEPSLPLIHDFVRQLRPFMAAGPTATGGDNRQQTDAPAAPFPTFQEWVRQAQLPDDLQSPTATSSSADDYSLEPESRELLSRQARVSRQAASSTAHATDTGGSSLGAPDEAPPMLSSAARDRPVSFPLGTPLDSLAPRPAQRSTQRDVSASGSAAASGSRAPTNANPTSSGRSADEGGVPSTAPGLTATAAESAPGPPLGRTHGPSLARPGPMLPARPGSQPNLPARPRRTGPRAPAAPSTATAASPGGINMSDTIAALSSSNTQSQQQQLPADQNRPQIGPRPEAALSQVMSQLGPVMQQLMASSQEGGGDGAGSGAPSSNQRSSNQQQGATAAEGQPFAAMLGPLMQQMGPLIGQMMGGEGAPQSAATASEIAPLRGGSEGAGHNPGGMAAIMQQMGPMIGQIMSNEGAGGPSPATTSGPLRGSSGSSDPSSMSSNGGMASIMQQLVASPAMQQMMVQLTGGMDSSQGGGRTDATHPLGGQAREASMGIRTSPSLSQSIPGASGPQRIAGVPLEMESSVRAAFSPDAADEWLNTLRADEPQIAEAARRELPDAYTAGHLDVGNNDAFPFGNSSDLPSDPEPAVLFQSAGPPPPTSDVRIDELD